jgi:hypothetical protein
MMFKTRQGLTFKQSPKYHGLVRRFLHGHQVLNLTEGYHPLDPVLWASILEDSELSRVLGTSGCVTLICKQHQFDPIRLVRIRPINLVHLLHLGNEWNGGMGFLRTEEGKEVENMENLLMAIVWIENL